MRGGDTGSRECPSICMRKVSFVSEIVAIRRRHTVAITQVHLAAGTAAATAVHVWLDYTYSTQYAYIVKAFKGKHVLMQNIKIICGNRSAGCGSQPAVARRKIATSQLFH